MIDSKKQLERGSEIAGQRADVVKILSAKNYISLIFPLENNCTK
jgi:hypothetical protein